MCDKNKSQTQTDITAMCLDMFGSAKARIEQKLKQREIVKDLIDGCGLSEYCSFPSSDEELQYAVISLSVIIGRVCQEFGDIEVPFSPSIERNAFAIMTLCNQLEQERMEEIFDLAMNMQPYPGHKHIVHALNEMAQQMFFTGVNLGRVIVLIAFTRLVCIRYYAQHKDYAIIVKISMWLARWLYINVQLGMEEHIQLDPYWLYYIHNKTHIIRYLWITVAVIIGAKTIYSLLFK